MLRSLLNGVEHVRAPGEICNVTSSSVRSDPISYLRFRAQACVSDPDFFYATQATQMRLLDDYFSLLRKQMPDAHTVILDVKYSHVHNFSGSWWDFSTRPFLLEFARKRGIKILHLVREKVYQTAISNIYALESGVWRARKPEELPTATIVVNPKALERRVRHLVRTIQSFDEWLTGCKHLRITYESLNGNARPALRKLGRFLGLSDEIPHQPGFLKTMPPYAQSIENFGQLSSLIDISLAEIEETPRRARIR